MLAYLITRIVSSTLVTAVLASLLPDGPAASSARRALALIETAAAAEPLLALLKGG